MIGKLFNYNYLNYSPVLEKLITEGYETPKMYKTMINQMETPIKVDKSKKRFYY